METNQKMYTNNYYMFIPEDLNCEKCSFYSQREGIIRIYYCCNLLEAMSYEDIEANKNNCPFRKGELDKMTIQTEDKRKELEESLCC